MSEQADIQLLFDDTRLANILFGAQGSNLRLLEKLSGLRLNSCGASLSISGSNTELKQLTASLLHQFYSLIKQGNTPAPSDIRQAFQALQADAHFNLSQMYAKNATIIAPRRKIIAKSATQRAYILSLQETEITFGIGPAGTGKTYLAVGAAVALYLRKEVKRIILTRPAVEAGEKLGFLPGDIAEKINPYLRPLYDALYDLLEFERVTELIASGTIEIAPLAFMRGRTLNDAFVILDEAQNTTPEQMKMFLTRMGFNSRLAITGDITQIDLPIQGNSNRSGLVHAAQLLNNIPGINFVHFSSADIVRHPLVGSIVEAYGKQENPA